ncbi:MAG: hypothetical protein AMXMBFR16_10730 [Candidatus Uhrbacteria bacterium]
MTSYRDWQERVMDWWEKAQNPEVIAATHVGDEAVSACGDSIIAYGRLEGEVLADLSLRSRGCCLSQAAAAMVTELCRCMDINAAAAVTDVEVIQRMGGHYVAPERHKCVLAAIQAVRSLCEKASIKS